MAYPNSHFFALSYVAAELGEDEDLIYEVSNDMFSEDGCFRLYDKYPITDQTESIIIFTEDGIDSIRDQLAENRDYFIERKKAFDKPYHKD